MSPKFRRLVLVASLVTGISVAPMLMLGANATGRGVDVSNNQFVGTNGSNSINVYVGDDVTWHILDGTHTVTPYDQKQWGQNGSGDLDPGSLELYLMETGAKITAPHWLGFDPTPEDPRLVRISVRPTPGEIGSLQPYHIAVVSADGSAQFVQAQRMTGATTGIDLL